MRMRYLSAYWLGLLTLILSVSSTWADGLESEDAVDDLKAIERVGKALDGTILLSGEVVDETGQRLNRVEAHIRRGWYRGLPDNKEAKDVEETTIVNGAFSFDYRKCSGVALTFSREGYYPSDELDFFIWKMMPLTPEEEESVEAGATIPERILKRTNIRVVLEKQGKATQLLNRGGLLRHGADGTGVVLNFDLPRTTASRSGTCSTPTSFPGTAPTSSPKPTRTVRR